MHVRASRDGARLAIGSDDGKQALVSILELAGTSAMRRLTFVGQNRFPIWSPDGQRVAFQSDREGDSGIFVQRADGNGPAERLTKATGEVHIPESWSPDGRYMSFSVFKGVTVSLWVLSMADGKATRYGGVESTEPIGSVFSPDGQWIAYSTTPTAAGNSGFSSSRGVYIQPFPATGAYYQVPKRQPPQFDFHPVWGPKGTVLFYVPTALSGQLAAVTVTRQPGVVFGTLAMLPARVTAGRLSTETRAYDILPDGRFVGLVGASEADPAPVASSGQLRVVLNWFEELKQRVPP
jgi:Tol biopolymer transport system component